MPKHSLTVGHLYGNLLNTYGDNGNMLMLKYCAQQRDIAFTSKIISIHEPFHSEDYDLIFFGGGQDYEQVIVSKDIKSKKKEIIKYIENHGVMLAICGGFQLLGEYYIGANGTKISGIEALDHYTLSQTNNRFIGDIVIYNKELDETYSGFENHNGRTFLGKHAKPLGIVKEGYGNNGEDQTEGALYKNTFCSYFHGPILARNENLANRLLTLALKNKYGLSSASINSIF